MLPLQVKTVLFFCFYLSDSSGGKTEQSSPAVLMLTSTGKPKITGNKVLLFVFIAWAVFTRGKKNPCL